MAAPLAAGSLQTSVIASSGSFAAGDYDKAEPQPVKAAFFKRAKSQEKSWSLFSILCNVEHLIKKPLLA